MNNVLRETQFQTLKSDLRLEFSKGDGGGRLSGLLTKDGILRMMEAADYENIDQVFRSFGEIVDIICGNSESGPVTSVFSQYVNLRTIFADDIVDHDELRKSLIVIVYKLMNFKKTAIVIFGPYQTFNMGTSKWHTLSHFVDSSSQMDGNEYADQCNFEIAHKNFKMLYEKTSWKTRTVMLEAMGQDIESTLHSLIIKYTLKTIQKRELYKSSQQG